MCNFVWYLIDYNLKLIKSQLNRINQENEKNQKFNKIGLINAFSLSQALKMNIDWEKIVTQLFYVIGKV